MTRKKKSSASRAISVQQTDVGSPVLELKSRFQARSIPLEADFADLIDVADCGRKAVGKSPDVTPVEDTGLVLDGVTGQLKVLPETDKGISVTNGGIGVIVNQEKCISIDNSGIGVNVGTGLVINNNMLNVSYVRKGFTVTKKISTAGWYRLFWCSYYSGGYFSKILVVAKTADSKQVFTLDVYIDGSPGNNNMVYAVTVSNASAGNNAPIDLVRISLKGGGFDDTYVELHLVALNKDITIDVSYSPFDANMSPSQLSNGGGNHYEQISATTNGSMSG